MLIQHILEILYFEWDHLSMTCENLENLKMHVIHLVKSITGSEIFSLLFLEHNRKQVKTKFSNLVVHQN